MLALCSNKFPVQNTIQRCFSNFSVFPAKVKHTKTTGSKPPTNYVPEKIERGVRGTVMSFSTLHSYGFIKRNDNGEKVFCHADAIVRRVPRRFGLNKHLQVEFDVVTDKKGRLAATAVTLPGGFFIENTGYNRRNRDLSSGSSRSARKASVSDKERLTSFFGKPTVEMDDKEKMQINLAKYFGQQPESEMDREKEQARLARYFGTSELEFDKEKEQERLARYFGKPTLEMEDKETLQEKLARHFGQQPESIVDKQKEQARLERFFGQKPISMMDKQKEQEKLARYFGKLALEMYDKQKEQAKLEKFFGQQPESAMDKQKEQAKLEKFFGQSESEKKEQEKLANSIERMEF